ncbi:hypothetical protein GUJ93_ZPchr0001g32550 [Zizania palustris]|uniref:Secreted protein n=1 Tax=Zizania palustris TaxID=103762 RepID=A0A8J5VPS7_ZIZPA|nr:hypothetical protein GUJ93_ZPchr0001g32550 [Zizania palustris]
MGSEPPAAAIMLAPLLLEATGDSEAETAPADNAGWSVVHVDDGDAESCCGGDDGGGSGAGSVELLSWERWMLDSASCYMVAGDGLCAASATEDAAVHGGDAESDRLFWEACIAHGY